MRPFQKITTSSPLKNQNISGCLIMLSLPEVSALHPYPVHSQVDFDRYTTSSLRDSGTRQIESYIFPRTLFSPPYNLVQKLRGHLRISEQKIGIPKWQHSEREQLRLLKLVTYSSIIPAKHNMYYNCTTDTSAARSRWSYLRGRCYPKQSLSICCNHMYCFVCVANHSIQVSKV
jgi:hypothetical protein